jgi:hypothetical protein
MSGFTEADVADLMLCTHGDRRKFCLACSEDALRYLDSLADMPESQIEAECTKLLEEDGWRSLRTDPVSDRSRGKGFGEVGMADHLYLRYRWTEPLAEFDILAEVLAEVMWIEFKRPGERAKKQQQEWHSKERARGGLTLIAGEDFPATVNGFKNWYAGSGLRR